MLQHENRGSASFDYTGGLLAHVDREIGGGWTLVLLSRADILNIMLPDHPHPAENPSVLIPKPGMTVSAAAGRIRDITQETACAGKTYSPTKTAIFLRCISFCSIRTAVS